MRTFTTFWLLTFLISCNQKSVDSVDKTYTGKLNKATTNISSKFTDYDQDNYLCYSKSKYSLDSSANYEAGDCWGKIYAYSADSCLIAMDSMICSEYSLNYSHYQFYHSSVKAHYKQSSTLYDMTSTKYILTEEIYELVKTPYVYYYRQDTFERPDFKLLTTDFAIDTIENYDKTYHDIKRKYSGSWALGVEE